MPHFHRTPEGAFGYLVPMVLLTGLIAAAVMIDHLKALITLGGLLAFGVMFALTSSAHSYLILAYSTSDDEVATDVGFYYSANAAGRLVGTLLSGALFVVAGFAAALVGAAVFLMASFVAAFGLPPLPEAHTEPQGEPHVAVP